MENDSTATWKRAGAFSFKYYRRKVHFLSLHLIFSCLTTYRGMHVFCFLSVFFILLIKKKEGPKIFLCKAAKDNVLYRVMCFDEDIVLEEIL